MKKMLKKAFTLVELLVVIAILAALATVGIISFSAYTKKANNASDNTLLSQLNHTLVLMEDEPDTYYDMREFLYEQAGVEIDRISTFSKNCKYAWDSSKNKLYLVENGTNIIEPSEDARVLSDEEKLNLFVPVSSDSEFEGAEATYKGFSVALREDAVISDGVCDIVAGFDACKNTTVTTVNYNSSSEKNVVIRTNCSKLNVKDTSDNSKICHYGYAGLINVAQCADHSYYEYGTTNILDVTDGHVVLTNEAVVNKEVHLSIKEGNTSYDGDIILTVETTSVPSITRDALGTENITKQLVCEIKKAESSEFIWIKETGEESKIEVTSDRDGTTAVTNVSSQVAAVKEDIANESNGEKVEEKGSTSEQKLLNNEAAENGKFVRISNASVEEYNGLTSIEEMSYIINGGSFGKKNYIADPDAYVGATIELLADMNLKDTNWMPWGISSNVPFEGFELFDGKGYVISGLSAKNTQMYVNDIGTSAQPSGLIGFLMGDVSFKDITIEINAISNNGSIGAYIGAVQGTTISGGVTNNCNISFNNCIAKGTINAGDKVAGFIGTAYISGYGGANSLTFKDCKNYVNVTSTSRAAGFIGATSSAKTLIFENCINYGNITNAGSFACGGILCYCGSGTSMNFTFKNCSNTGTLEFDETNGHNLIGYAVGDTGWTITIDDIKKTEQYPKYLD